MKTTMLRNRTGTTEELYQWYECKDDNCDPGKHPACWKCVVCGRLIHSIPDAIECERIRNTRQACGAAASAAP